VSTKYSVLSTKYPVLGTLKQVHLLATVAAPLFVHSLCFLSFLLFNPLVSAQENRPRPNILLLVADDQRPDTIGILGNSQIRTPHLDDLVRRGTAFTRASCAHPLCYPSRAELLTGCTGFRNGTFSTQRLTGYGGWQFQTDEGQRFPEKGIGLTADISAEFADAAIRQIKKESARPFFIHVNFTAPHDPRIWPTGYEQMYDPAKLPFPKSFVGEHPFDHGNLRGRDELLLPFPRTETDVRQELACYYAVISHMDAQIGRIFAALDETDKRDNTIIVYTADHGLAIGSHGLVGKQNMYEHTINVPLVIAGPGVSYSRMPRGQWCFGQCYLRDLFPTLCELVKIRVPDVDGKSLRSLLSGDQSEIYPYTIGYFQDSQRMIRERNWKLIWYPKTGRWQLFDLEADPDELRDLIDNASLAPRIDDLRGKLFNWLKRQGDHVVWQKHNP
jgi:arylsulfatase A-like enzyme